MDNMEHRKAILSENLIRFVKANGWTEMEAARRGGFNPQASVTGGVDGSYILRRLQEELGK